MSDGLHGGPDDREATRTFLAMVVILTFVMNMIGRGVTETFAVFLLPVQEGLAVSRSEITLTYSIYMLANGATAPFAGQLLIAIDPAGFAGAEIFANRIAALAAMIETDEGARLPGTKRLSLREKAAATGVAVDAKLLADVSALAAQ